MGLLWQGTLGLPTHIVSIIFISLVYPSALFSQGLVLQWGFALVRTDLQHGQLSTREGPGGHLEPFSKSPGPPPAPPGTHAQTWLSPATASDPEPLPSGSWDEAGNGPWFMDFASSATCHCYSIKINSAHARSHVGLCAHTCMFCGKKTPWYVYLKN